MLENGPSDNAWGAPLSDPVIVSHQGQLVLFARAESAPVDHLYFKVLSPTETVTSGSQPWKGWFRFRFAEASVAGQTVNLVGAADQQQSHETRVSGMDLITVPPEITRPVPSSAAFQVLSDGTYLLVLRQSESKTLYLNRLVLLSRKRDEGGTSVKDYFLEPAWETRFRRSGLKDIPADVTDTPSYTDPGGRPFYEPTIELTAITGVENGAVAAAIAPTSDPDAKVLYVAVAGASATKLYQVRQTEEDATNFTAVDVAAEDLAPELAGGTALLPVPGLAPALMVYGEREAGDTLADGEVELERTAHLTVAIPVKGGVFTNALAVFDFAVDQDGNVPSLPQSDQVLEIGDGTMESGKYVPDTASKSYPLSSVLPNTVRVIDGHVVSSYLLGQIEPVQSPCFLVGDDGLAHLYYGGPKPAGPIDRWSPLDPNLPQAMVAQFDTRANRLTLSVPWQTAQPTSQANGTVSFLSLQSGSALQGAKVTVADTTFSEPKAAASLCDVTVDYPAKTGLPQETWVGVPRSVEPFLDVLNGKASDDSADPAVLAGMRQCFDFTGTRPVAFAPIEGNGGASLAAFVSARADIPLTSAALTRNGDGGSVALALSFELPGKVTITATWPGLDVPLRAYPPVLEGTASAETYAYPADGTVPLIALRTDSIGNAASVILYSKSGTTLGAMSVAVAQAGQGKVKLTFTGTSAGTVTTGALSAAVDEFLPALEADTGFKTLGLGVTAGTASGNIVRTDAPLSELTLADCGALVDLILPQPVAKEAALTADTYTAGRQSHTLTPASTKYDITRMIGFMAASPHPPLGVVAHVQNSDENVEGATRYLSFGEAESPLLSGGWVRHAPQVACAFDGTNAALVPVTTTTTAPGQNPTTVPLPQSARLQPQPDWTLEAWFRPDDGERRRILTFLDTVSRVLPGEPSMRYAFDTIGQNVFSFAPFAFQPGYAGSTYFYTGTSGNASFSPSGGFTWEVWVQPQAVAGPDAAGTVEPAGVILQVGTPQSTLLQFGLSSQREVYLSYLDNNGETNAIPTNVTVPDTEEGVPAWSHLSLVGKQAGDGSWTLEVLLDASIAFTSQPLQLGTVKDAVLSIGSGLTENATIYGRITQLRYWNLARSGADIRRTWLTSLTGSEYGLLGNWPLSEVEPGPPGVTENTATITGADWNAQEVSTGKQAFVPVQDSAFLGLIGTVGGLPSYMGRALFATGRWNHLAVAYQAGGAVAMNPPERYNSGTYDWIDCGAADDLAIGSRFAFDTWVWINPGPTSEVGTILGRWSPNATPDAQSFRIWVDQNGEINLTMVVSQTRGGGWAVPAADVRSQGAGLADGRPHHVALTLTSVNKSPAETGGAAAESTQFTVVFYVDGKKLNTVPPVTLPDVDSFIVRQSQANLVLGASFVPVEGEVGLPAPDYGFFQGTIGRTRFWSDAVPATTIFALETLNGRDRSGYPDLAAEWSFLEREGLFTADVLGTADGTLSNSSMWALMTETSALEFYSNGVRISSVSPAASPLEFPATSIFSMGSATGALPHTDGLKGEIAQVSLWNYLREPEEIADQRFTPRNASDQGLIACWNFSHGGTDITLGKNDISPAPPSSLLSTSAAPLSNEGPLVRNVYGGEPSDYNGSTPGRIATGSYASARNIGTARQTAVVKRAYVLSPVDSHPQPIEVGPLKLIYVGQVQTDPTLIGYIEGAPPVPSENLSRPYYRYPSSSLYLSYLDASTVTLAQSAGDTVGFSSNSSHQTQISTSAAIGLMGMREVSDISTGFGPFSISNRALDLKGNAQLRVEADGTLGGSAGSGLSQAWTDAQTDKVGLSGDWEPFASDPDDLLNPAVGRRYLADNIGYALVESLSADLYATIFEPTGAALGTIILPNPAIPPDRNILHFPIDPAYTQIQTLDGKVGFVNMPGLPNPDIERGSYFKPYEAYGLAAEIEAKRVKSESTVAQFDVQGAAQRWDSSLADTRAALTVDFDATPGDPMPTGVPVQGLANRYVWTADGGLHTESQSIAGGMEQTYSGRAAAGFGGGVHGDGQFFFKAGFQWSLDLMATHQMSVSVAKSDEKTRTVDLRVTVSGESYLKPFDGEADSPYGGKGKVLDDPVPGKVQAYRFMSLYLPPSRANAATFRSIVEPSWRALSNDSTARAIREMDAGSPAWRVLHRVTYVSRIPPPVASRPTSVAEAEIAEPVNLSGNADLIALVIKDVTKTPTMPMVADAVRVAINPAPTAPGVYPDSILEKGVAWWRGFLDDARPDKGGSIASPSAARLLDRITADVTDYIYRGYVTGVLEASRPL